MELGVLLIITGFLVSCAVIDAEHLNDQDYIEDHTSRFIQRAIFCGIWMYIAPKYTLIAILFFVVFFDITLNLLRKLPLDYLGKTAKWDKFFRKRMWLYYSVKILGLGTIAYLLL